MDDSGSLEKFLDDTLQLFLTGLGDFPHKLPDNISAESHQCSGVIIN